MDTPIPLLDLMFLLTESRDNPRHVGAALIFEKPARGGADIVPRILEAYRCSKPVPPFNFVPLLRRLGMPQWHEVHEFDMHWHVQHLALPSPGTDAQLHELVTELHAPMLERSRPGWRAFIIDGLERNRFALFIKVHHSLVDGESGIDLTQRSLSRSPRDRRIRTLVETKLPAPKRHRYRRLVPRLEHEVEELVQRALSVGLGSGRVVEELLAGFRGYSASEARPFTAPLTPMNEPIHSARSISHVMLPLDRMKAVGAAAGATVNDVALCVLDAAMNRYLHDLGRKPDRPLVAVCPVSLQDPEAKQATTRVSIFWTPLGSPSAPIGRRLQQIVAGTREAKQRIGSLPKDAAYAYSVGLFVLGESVAAIPRGSRDVMVGSNVLISNVRGPAEPLYLGGARLEALVPVSTLISGMGLNITFMSYAGQVIFGFTANASALPDAGRLAEYTSEAFAALARSARRKARR